MKNIAKVTALACLSGFFGMAAGAATDYTTLPVDEREVIEKFNIFNSCLEHQIPAHQRAVENFNQQTAQRSAYITRRADELAHQRADASMHVMIAAALSEGMTEDEADDFVQAMIESDKAAIIEKLGQITPPPPPPPEPVKVCEERTGLDHEVIHTRIGQLTHKYGNDILAPSAPVVQ